MWKGEGGVGGETEARARGVFKQAWGRVGSLISKSCEVVSGREGRLPNVGVGGARVTAPQSRVVSFSPGLSLSAGLFIFAAVASWTH